MIMIKHILFCLAILTFIPCGFAEHNITEIQAFLLNDSTNEHSYKPWYTCGHFARDLSRNASDNNITIRSVILSNHPVFRGKWNSHIMNYIIINNTILLIESQTDQIMFLNQTVFDYYRLYHNGDQVPSFWDCNLAHTGKIN